MTSAQYLVLIGSNISKLRKKNGLTSKELGLRCDIEKSNLINIEKGRINVTANTLLKLANALEVEVVEFFKF
ncbi:MAG: helix-turn-helix transcriptional regulator [Bacteroidota bacterium]